MAPEEMKLKGMTTLGIGGWAEVFIDGQFVGKFHNVVTDACKGRILRTLLQSAGDQLDATHFAKYMVFSAGAVPVNPGGSAIGTLQTPASLIVVSGFTVGADSVYATLTGSWTNATGGTVAITYFACNYGGLADTTADKQYMVVPITAQNVLDTQTITINYTLYIVFDA